MAGEVPRQGGSRIVESGPRGVGKAFLVGGSIVAGGLFSFYYSMLSRKKKEQAAGRNPYYEQVTGHLTRKWDQDELEDLHRLRGVQAEYSNIPPAFPATEHHSGHMTIDAFNRHRRNVGAGGGGGDAVSGAASGGVGVATVECDGEGMGISSDVDSRNMIPPPQRGRGDGSGKAYTKSPDYAKNYEKTERGKTKSQETVGGST